jgi:hypothetical protein
MFTSEGKAGSQNVQMLNSVVEGPSIESAFLFDGSAAGVEIRNCRVWNASSGIRFSKPVTDTNWRVDVVNNTFHTLRRNGLHIEHATLTNRPEIRISITQNLFLALPLLAQVDFEIPEAKFLTSYGNMRQTGTAPGSPLMKSSEVSVDLPLNPADRAHFLMYEPSNQLFTAFNGKPVGAPPE